MLQRPPLHKDLPLDDFTNFYWLKKELTDFCKKEKLSTQGGKFEITQRIEHYLKTGERLSPTRPSKKATSSFDWKNATLHLQTIITDNYKNSENVRTFFQKEIGKSFKFNVKFMNWMKANTGKTLGDAIDAWKEISNKEKTNTQPKEIAPQFKYNTYLRDALADNPEMKRKDAITLWKIKKSMRGDNIYRKSDLDFL